MSTRKDPLIIEIESETLPDAPSPAEAPQPLEAPAGARVISAAGSRGWGLGAWLLSTIGALLALWIGVSAVEFVTTLFSGGGWLGWVGAGLLGLLCLLLVILALREMLALSRISRVEGLRMRAAEVHETGSGKAADSVIRGLMRLYGGRADLEWAKADFGKAIADAPDPQGRLALAERSLMAPLDQAAEASVRKASRNVAAATALIPLALVDVIAALTCNLRMVREIAEIYGGRAGWLGSWRLMKAVAAHLVATGAVAVADDLLGPLVGGGVLGKLSRRFGEGAVNGALTARVGVAAIEICRPMPFAELSPPKASSIVLGALSSWRGNSQKNGG